VQLAHLRPFSNAVGCDFDLIDVAGKKFGFEGGLDPRD
jgi:hypothetical protein